MSDRQRCMACADKVPWLAFWLNLALAIYKMGLGYLGASTALIADGLHSLTDVVGTTMVLVSRRVSSRPADDDHPYGRGKAEFMSSAFVYIILVVVAVGIFAGGASVIIKGNMKPPRLITLLAAGISIAVNLLMYRLGQCAGTRTNSPALLANSFENRADAVSSFAAVIGISLAVLVHPVCDALAAMVVGAIILVNCVGELRKALVGLMDQSLGEGATERIGQLALRHHAVRAVNFVRTRQTGHGYWLDLGVTLPGDTPIEQADQVAQELQQQIRTQSDHFAAVEVFVTQPSG